MSAPGPVYGLPGDAVADEPPKLAGSMLPLMVLFVGLAVATMWFVARPAFDKTPRAERSCEVFVLKSGSITCVAKPILGSRAVPQKPKPKHSSRAKH